MRLHTTVIGLALVVGSATACQKIWGFEDFEEGAGGAAGSGVGGSAGSGGTAGSSGGSGGASGGSGGSAGAGPCTDPIAPAGMVGVRVTNGTCVWIDPKEVTRAEYDTFRAGAPTNPSNCSGNSSFDAPQDKQGTTPCLGPGETPDGGVDGGADAGTPPGDVPVTCVDWCDAAGYCASKQKVLCPGTVNQPTKGAWFDVCSSNGTNDYPYAGPYQSNYCNDSSVTGKSLLSVGSKTECKTPSGVFDMAGNASEWLDACTGTGESDECDTRGGNFNDNSGLAMCGGSVKVSKKLGLPTVGFRCCWLPK